ncbi:hypothetical protein [Pedobacter sp. P26]|uniref:hypothetical protein n=1 Tax=Pedobacter sp. P26 TaxID=3423956 RepID=UPI003D67CAF2
MKKILSLLTAICFVALIVISCNKDKNGVAGSGSAVKTDKGLKSLLGNYLPDDINVQKNNVAIVRLLPSAAQYTLDLSSPDAKNMKLF